MKKLFFGFSVAVLFLAISPFTIRAQAARLWVAPRPGVWKVTAGDEANTKWSGQLRLSKVSGRGSVKYKGYFYWVSGDKVTSGREYFTGHFMRRTGKLRLAGFKVKNNRGELGTSNYVASVNQKGKNIHNGSWSGNGSVPGKWSAVWTRAR